MANSIEGTGPWTTRFSKWAMFLGIFAAVVSVGGAFLAGQDIIPKMTGVSSMFAGAAMALLGTIFGLLGVGMNLRNKGALMKSALIGLLLSGGHAGFMASRAAIGSKVPAIHDVTTDLQNPPSFVKIKMADDNLRGVGTVEKWRELHARAYSSLNPVVLSKAPAAVIADAERLAKERGWEVVNADPDKGIFEATASVSLIKFKDDVVLRITPTVDGKGSRVDMRSVSRVGISDLGVNAQRIRDFLAALAKA